MTTPIEVINIDGDRAAAWEAFTLIVPDFAQIDEVTRNQMRQVFEHGYYAAYEDFSRLVARNPGKGLAGLQIVGPKVSS